MKQALGRILRVKVVSTKFLFLLVAATALVTYWLTMSIRYEWYLQPLPGAILRSIIMVVISSVVVLWIWYPSRVLTVAAASLGFVLPPLTNETFVPLDLAFAPYVLVVIGLVCLATHLRRTVIAEDNHAP